MADPESNHSATYNTFRKFMTVLSFLNLKLRAERRVSSAARLNLEGPNYITGELNEASPRFTSANAHQICTLATFFTYFGTTISFL